jgi:hypothetical protein
MYFVFSTAKTCLSIRAVAFSFALKLIRTLPAATAGAFSHVAGTGATGRFVVWLNRWLRGTGRFSHSSGIGKTQNTENAGIAV